MSVHAKGVQPSDCNIIQSTDVLGHAKAILGCVCYTGHLRICKDCLTVFCMCVYIYDVCVYAFVYFLLTLVPGLPNESQSFMQVVACACSVWKLLSTRHIQVLPSLVGHLLIKKSLLMSSIWYWPQEKSWVNCVHILLNQNYLVFRWVLGSFLTFS